MRIDALQSAGEVLSGPALSAWTRASEALDEADLTGSTTNASFHGYTFFGGGAHRSAGFFGGIKKPHPARIANIRTDVWSAIEIWLGGDLLP